MKVTNDKYELPLVVADSVQELADILGVSRNSIYSSMSHVKAGDSKSTPYRKVEVEE
jgi:predicted DNA-binding transcriptional regulator AlpA